MTTYNPYQSAPGAMTQRRPDTSLMGSNPFTNFLEQQNPRAIYDQWFNRGSQPRYDRGQPAYAYGKNFSPVQQRYFQNNFDQVYNDYLGRLTNAISGMDASQTEDFLRQPGGTFNDFLGQGGNQRPLGTFNPWSFWQDMTPNMRGENNQAFAPQTRWLGFM